ncbi:hypothetical protein A2801_03865 [Candidatus Woesebacteria bacterium RIFCSPHIGHO2_01_FULL_41_10]|uniref:Uncharacterized protein n=1 Tax=Candidatus Woesebacteria bacterium RIFCSPHIGHO2_01_FULL_41_10 TaxID=1802500 RepID=A0A1F7YSA0_9BACT|nr:MAG: hypothetical protein A2801_03865 [Candidatus Woesebacteria bacterium RIFCSPHIGHO2_01_FULL_41_10]
MSRLFYDHLLDLDELETRVKVITKDREEQNEIFRLIDEIVHHRVVGCILNHLPEEHHEKFLVHLSERPHDKQILDFLRDKILEDIEGFIKQEIRTVAIELLKIVADENSPEVHKLKARTLRKARNG